MMNYQKFTSETSQSKSSAKLLSVRESSRPSEHDEIMSFAKPKSIEAYQEESFTKQPTEQD